MTFISYAQNYEDVMLYRALKHINKGFYVDVGAGDPIFDSVTQAFYERGWQGINIEPLRSYYDSLCYARPLDINLSMAAADKEGELTFFEIPETGLSTLDQETAEKQRLAGWGVTGRKVSVLTLNQILEKHVNCPIHFLKIDVEGAEKQVLQGLDLLCWRPWILVIEATKPSSPELYFEAWETLILSAEYEMVYFDGLNRFYVANEHSTLTKLLRTPPNVFDGFVTYHQKNALDERNLIRIELDEVRVDRKQIRKQLANIKADRDQILIRLDDTRTDREHIRKQLDEVWAERNKYWSELDVVYRSLLWRLFAPFRTLSRNIHFWKDRISTILHQPFLYIVAKILSRIGVILRRMSWGVNLLNKFKVWYPKLWFRVVTWMKLPTPTEPVQLSPVYFASNDELSSKKEKHFLELFQRELFRRQKNIEDNK